MVTDQFGPFECEGVGPANECKCNSEEAWRCWAPLSHTVEQLKLGSIVAAFDIFKGTVVESWQAILEGLVACIEILA